MLKRKKSSAYFFFVVAFEQLRLRINCQHFPMHNELTAYLFCKNSIIISDWCWWDINTRMTIDICLYHIGLDTIVVIILAVTSIHHSIWSCHLNVLLIGDIQRDTSSDWYLYTGTRTYQSNVIFLKCILKGIYNSGNKNLGNHVMLNRFIMYLCLCSNLVLLPTRKLCQARILPTQTNIKPNTKKVLLLFCIF